MDTRHRKYLLTINNPSEDWTHDKIREALSTLHLTFWALSDEIGNQEHTPHTHVFFASTVSAIRFSTVKKLFPTAHIEPARGSCEDNLAYIQKSGKWETDDKCETSLPGTYEEWGERPTEHQGSRSDLTTLYEYIKDGLTDFDILEKDAAYLLNLEKIERARQVVREHQYRDVFRAIETTYIWGKTGLGKTRGVMEKYSYSGVYRVTDYQHPFDSYAGEDVLLLDEYSSNFKIRALLTYLDGYPLTLPCRYTNRVACYTKVYIISNLCLTKQYPDIQRESPATFTALLRRIDKVILYTAPNQYVEYETAEYMENPFLHG